MVTTRRQALEALDSGKIRRNENISSNGTQAIGEGTSKNKTRSGFTEKIKVFATDNFTKVVDPSRCSWWPYPILLLAAELVINLIVIEKVPYTEIDWKAYMQEVSSTTIIDPINGTTDYSVIKGDTGPLVYPAGFVWIYSMLYKLTKQGADVRKAQYIFAVLYVLTVALVFRLLIRTKKVPVYVLAMMCLTSYRIHSIYALRLFNDPVAMLLLYLAVNAFSDGWWYIGSVIYSLAVSVKMNILLFSPALLIAFIVTQGVTGAIKQVSTCALIQLLVGYPFLSTYPLEYLKGSFDIGRVFLYEWTVNWRFLSEEIFIHRGFHAILLTAHIVTLLLMVRKWWSMLKSYNQNKNSLELLLVPLYTCNFVGMMFARSLHYQFYIWYYHQLHLLIFSTKLQGVMKLLILGLIELCWNVFPSTIESSVVLNICHVFVLYHLARATTEVEKKQA